MANPGRSTESSTKQTRIGEATTGMRIPRQTVRKAASNWRIVVIGPLRLCECRVKGFIPNTILAAVKPGNATENGHVRFERNVRIFKIAQLEMPLAPRGLKIEFQCPVGILVREGRTGARNDNFRKTGRQKCDVKRLIVLRAGWLSSAIQRTTPARHTRLVAPV